MATIGNTAGTKSRVSTIGFGSTTFTVATPNLVSIAITPANFTILQGKSVQYTATGTYDGAGTQNITNLVVWISSDLEVVAVNASGPAAHVALGTTTITAASGTVSGAASLTVQLKSRRAYAKNDCSTVTGDLVISLLQFRKRKAGNFTL